MTPVRRIRQGMSTDEIMSFRLGELLAAQVEDKEAMRLYTIDYGERGRLLFVMAVDDEEGLILLEEVGKRVNARRAAAGLPPRDLSPLAPGGSRP